MQFGKRLLSLAVAAVLAVGGAVVTAGPASASGRDGTCAGGEFCYYFHAGQTDSVSDFTDSLADYGSTQPNCYEFKSAGAGQGVCVKNHAESVWNRTSRTVRIYYNSDFRGSYQDVAPNTKANLNSTLKNNEASHQLLASTGPTGCATDGTNSKLPSSILVYRVSLKKVERVAFKTYVKNVLPNEWFSSWPPSSLDAGAMAVKSYGWYWALHSTRKTPSGQCFDVRDDTGSQVYRPSSAVSSTSAAVERTWNTRMTRSGKIFEAHYCSTSTACSAWVTGDWMSQYGSRDQAAAGKKYAAILNYYYRGIALTS